MDSKSVTFNYYLLNIFIVSVSTSFILDSLREPILYKIMDLSAVNNLLGLITFAISSRETWHLQMFH